MVRRLQFQRYAKYLQAHLPEDLQDRPQLNRRQWIALTLKVLRYLLLRRHELLQALLFQDFRERSEARHIADLLLVLVRERVHDHRYRLGGFS